MKIENKPEEFRQHGIRVLKHSYRSEHALCFSVAEENKATSDLIKLHGNMS